MHNWPTKKTYRERRPDTVYLLSSCLYDNAGRRLYKFGVTRADLGDKRLETLRVAAYKYELEYVKKVKTVEHARTIEKQLLQLGERSKARGFAGSTEFRWLTEAELTTALGILSRCELGQIDQPKPKQKKPRGVPVIQGL